MKFQVNGNTPMNPTTPAGIHLPEQPPDCGYQRDSAVGKAVLGKSATTM